MSSGAMLTTGTMCTDVHRAADTRRQVLHHVSSQEPCCPKTMPCPLNHTHKDMLHSWLQSMLMAMKTWRMHSPRLLLLLIFFSYPLHALVNAEEVCTMQPIQMQIRYRNCAPRVVLLYACSGSCSSYSQPNPNYPTQMDRSCRCCRELGRRRVAVVLRCPRSEGSGRDQRVALRLRIPTRCACRPCSG